MYLDISQLNLGFFLFTAFILAAIVLSLAGISVSRHTAKTIRESKSQGNYAKAMVGTAAVFALCAIAIAIWRIGS